MRAGRLRHRVTLETRSTSVDSLGARVDTWTTIATRRCDIKPLTGKENTADNAIEYSRVTTEIRLRYDSNLSRLKPHDRAVDYSQSPAVVYDIESVINLMERDREILLRCERDGA